MTISRRHFLSAAAAFAAVAPASALAAQKCSGYNPNGMEACSVGVEIGAIETARQRCPYWCWAASIQTIFALHGYDLDQEAIVDRLFGSTVCATADGQQIVQTITGSWQDRHGRPFTAWAETLFDVSAGIWRADSMDQIIAELAAGNPLMNGSEGHATVLTAATYAEDGYGHRQLIDLIVRDPWPDNPNRREMTMDEVSNTLFIAKVGVG